MSFIKLISRRIYLFIKTKPYLQYLLVFSFLFILFNSLYMPLGTLSSGDDHFFHFRFAEQMTENGFLQSFHDFKAIYLSKMAQTQDYFVYYNFLFYLLIIPFSLITPLYLGIKLYAIFAVSLSLTILYGCLKKLNLSWPFLYIVIFLSIVGMTSIWRFFLSRPYTLAPILLVLFMYFISRKKYWGVFVISFIYLFWHSSTFFFPLAAAICYWGVQVFYRTKPDYKNLLYTIGGTLVAIFVIYLISPGFIVFMKQLIIDEILFNDTKTVYQGRELYPFNLFDFISNNLLMFSSFITLVCADIYAYILFRTRKLAEIDFLARMPIDNKYLQTSVLLITLVFFVSMVSLSGRFRDFFTFFAALYSILTFEYLYRSISLTGNTLIKRGLYFGLIVMLIYLLSSNLLALQSFIAKGQSPIEFYQVGNWLARNTKPGDVVFETNWGWFPQLYYWSPKNYYTMGLDPRYLYDYDPELYWLSEHIPTSVNLCKKQSCPEMKEELTRLVATKNEKALDQYAIDTGNQIASILRQKFKSSYLVTSDNNAAFNYTLDQSSYFKKEIYDSIFGLTIYRILK